MGSITRILCQFGSRLSQFFFVPGIVFTETDRQTSYSTLLKQQGHSSPLGVLTKFSRQKWRGGEGGEDGDIRRLPDCWQTVQQTPTWCQQTRLEGADT